MPNLHRLLQQAVLTVICAWPLVSTAQLPSAPRKLEFLTEPTRFATQESLVDLRSEKPCVMAIGIVVDREGRVIEASVDKPVCTCTDERTIEQAVAVARGYAFGPSPDAPQRHWARITWEFNPPPAPAVREQEGERLPTPVDDPTIDAAYAKVRPEFPGGESGIQAYLRKALRYPEDLREAGIQGTVFLELVIGDDGSVSMVQVKRGVHPAMDQEAMRVVKAMPKWTPGRNIRGPVPVRMTLPVKFKVEERNSLPDWMVPLFGPRSSTKASSPVAIPVRGMKPNRFIGSCSGTVTRGGKTDHFTIWQDSARAILELRSDTMTTTILADLHSATIVLAISGSEGRRCVAMDQSAVAKVNMMTLQTMAGPWRRVRADKERTILGRPCKAYDGQSGGVTMCRLWVAEDIPFSAFADACNWVPMKGDGALSFLLVPGQLPGAMPLGVDARNYKVEVTEMKLGPQPLPPIDLRGCKLDDGRAGAKAP